jgi:cytochrome c551/c552
MKQFKKAWAGLMLTGAAAMAHAAVHEIKLPAEDAKLKSSPLPGYVVATQKCATCHSADYVKYQPPGMSLTQWTGEVAKMQHLYGAPISDDDVKSIGAYLAVAYGSAKESDLPAALKSVPALAAPPTSSAAPVGATVDATALLNANGCLGCHAIDKKVVGPAYHVVSAKYHGDPHALSMLEASIRNGSVGKWGEVPMPPFAQLKPAEVQALAEFVLKQ